MMQWLLLVTAACVTGLSLEQPTCFEDSQCTVGYYCLADVQHCRQCLRCEDLRRQPPENNVNCVKSVVECGVCEIGLVEDREGVGAGCKEPEAEGAIPSYMPAYVWAVIVICLLLFALVLVALVYMLRHTDTFKVLASTRTSVQAPVVSNGAPPSAPQPPPYNYGHYEPVRPASPPQTAPYDDTAAAMPFVKRAGSARGAGGGGAARESAGSQNARVFGNPAYVRNVPPPSYDSAFSDDSDHEPFVPQDEDTMESVWTPEPRYDDHNENSTALATTVSKEQETASGPAPAPALRRDALEDSNPPPAKIRCIEDSNNNRNPDGGESSSSPPPPPPAAPPAPPPAAPSTASVVINVLNVNSVR